jgi:hypothetical protein
MGSAFQVFAEAPYETAYRRGITAADAVFDWMLAAQIPIPSQWPGSVEGTVQLVMDLLRAGTPEETQRLIRVVAYSGSCVRWRRKVLDLSKRNRASLCADVIPFRADKAIPIWQGN